MVNFLFWLFFGVNRDPALSDMMILFIGTRFSNLYTAVDTPA
jgi:hypothetical protein